MLRWKDSSNPQISQDVRDGVGSLCCLENVHACVFRPCFRIASLVSWFHHGHGEAWSSVDLQPIAGFQNRHVGVWPAPTCALLCFSTELICCTLMSPCVISWVGGRQLKKQSLGALTSDLPLLMLKALILWFLFKAIFYLQQAVALNIKGVSSIAPFKLRSMARVVTQFFPLCREGSGSWPFVCLILYKACATRRSR